MTKEEILQGYARYSFIEGTIDEDTMNHLIEDAQNYISKLKELNLINYLNPTTEEVNKFLDDNYPTKTFKPFKGAVDVCTKCLRGGCICEKPTRTHYITTEEIDERLYLNSYPKEK